MRFSVGSPFEADASARLIPTAVAVGSCEASEQSSSDEKGDVSDVIYTLTDFYRTPIFIFDSSAFLVGRR